MQDFFEGLFGLVFMAIYWLAGGCYLFGLYAVAKYEGIAMFLLTLCVPVLGQLYGAWAGFKFLFL